MVPLDHLVALGPDCHRSEGKHCEEAGEPKVNCNLGLMYEHGDMKKVAAEAGDPQV